MIDEDHEIDLKNRESKNENGNEDGIIIGLSLDEKNAYNPRLKKNNVGLDPQNFNAIQLKNFLSKFFIIKTPYGYSLGRNYGPMKAKRNSFYWYDQVLNNSKQSPPKRNSFYWYEQILNNSKQSKSNKSKEHPQGNHSKLY